MKILHVIPSIAKVRGGPSEAVIGIVKSLRSSGVNVEIVTTNDNGSELLDVPLNQWIEYEQVPVYFLPRFFLPMKEFIFSGAMTQWLWQHVREYNLIHTHYLFSYVSTCAGAIARQQKVPYVVSTIGQLHPWALAQSRRKKEIYTFLLERRNLNRAAAIHCTSMGEAEDVRNFGIATPTLALPLGVDAPRGWPGVKQKLHDIYQIPATTPIVLFLSRLHYKKRPDLLIESLARLTEQNSEFHLILAGSGEPEYLNYLHNLVSSKGLTSQTTFAGFVSGEDKDILLQGADIFVLPSFSENFGVAVAEAMAVGLPVIVTPNVQIAAEIATEQAGLVAEGEVESMSGAIARLLQSPELRQQLGSNGQRLARSRYSWKAIATNFETVYRSIIDRQPLPDCLCFS